MSYTLSGSYVHGDGSARVGRLKFEPSVAITDGQSIILPAPLEVVLDSAGAFSVALVGTDDPAYSPTGWVWTVTELLSGGRAAWSFELTADSDIGDLAGVPTPPDYSMYTLTVADTTTSDPGGDAAVSIAGVAGSQELSFTIPRGEAGPQGIQGETGATGETGPDGSSAYEVAVAAGFVGDEAAWLASLVGPQGETGPQGIQGETGATGPDGSSAYEVAVAGGFVGTEAAWLASLVGATGATGATGETGATGPAGADGADGGTLYYVADLGAVTASTPITVTHNLGTMDVQVTVVQKDTAAAGPGPGVELAPTVVDVTSANAVDLTFADSAAANLLRVTVLASGAFNTSIYAPLSSPTFTGTVTIPTPAAGSETTVAASTAWAAERAKVGNLLTANQASVETDTTGFTASASTLARATGGEFGTYCLQVTATAASAGTTMYGGTASGTMPVVAGSPYTFRARVKAATITRVVYARIYWWQSNGTSAASTASHTSAGVTLSTSWKTVDITAVAPANAAYASLYLYAASSASSEVYLADALGFWAGAGGNWTMPGTPITGLGKRVTHPNTDDVLVQHWDDTLGRWQTTHYDSGVRNVDSLINTAAWTIAPGTACYLRRVNNVAWVQFRVIATATPANAILTLPDGFRPAAHGGGYNQPYVATRGSSSANVRWLRINSAIVEIQSAVSGDGQFGPPTPLFLTSDDIPTSLPGVLVSAAPA